MTRLEDLRLRLLERSFNLLLGKPGFHQHACMFTIDAEIRFDIRQIGVLHWLVFPDTNSVRQKRFTRFSKTPFRLLVGRGQESLRFAIIASGLRLC